MSVEARIFAPNLQMRYFRRQIVAKNDIGPQRYDRNARSNR